MVVVVVVVVVVAVAVDAVAADDDGTCDDDKTGVAVAVAVAVALVAAAATAATTGEGVTPTSSTATNNVLTHSYRALSFTFTPLSSRNNAATTRNICAKMTAIVVCSMALLSWLFNRSDDEGKTA